MSPLGFDQDMNVVNADDTAEIYAYVTDQRDAPIPEDDLVSVSFTIQLPDGSKETQVGSIEGDGIGFLRWRGTEDVGEYKVVATFTLASSSKRSVRADFEVIDPFNPPAPDNEDILGALIWSRLEDLFDSEEGGPWLQDQTKSTFKKEKMKDFIAQALFDINNQQPATTALVGEFVHEGTVQPHAPLLIQGALIAVIRHLIRTYVEQPLPTGGQLTYEDRRDYLQRWQSVLQIEEQYYMRLLLLWKRSFLGVPGAKVLVGSKAGRLIQGPMRTRNVGRGYF